MIRRAAIAVALFGLLSNPAAAQLMAGPFVSQGGQRTIVYNALDNGLVGDCVTNDQSKLQTLVNTASAASTDGSQVRVLFPTPPGGCYNISGTVAIPANVDLEPVGSVVLQSQTGSGAFFTLTSVNNITIGAFTFDSEKSLHPSISQPITITSSYDVVLDHIVFINPTGAVLVTSSYRIHVLSPNIQNSLYHGVYFNATYDSEVLNGYFQNEVDFGIILTNGAYRNLLMGNRTTSNGIELIGVTSNSYQNQIIGNHAEGTGDNCISITGHENQVIGNEGIGCAGNGINVYGERNTVVGNYLKNNSQSHGSNSQWRAGIAIAQGFGGWAQRNVVNGNVMDDDQVSPTQQYGIWIAPTAYGAWQTSHAYAQSVYVFNGLNLYQSTNAATSGASAPTCTSGTCSDGAVTWQFISTSLTNDTLADGNEISGNNYVRSAIQNTLDASTAAGNEWVGGYNSSIANAGTVSGLSILTTGNYVNGSFPTLTIAAPAAGGVQATAHVATMKILGFGSLATGGSGCSANDVLNLVGGTPGGSGADQIKVLTVDGGGAVLTFTGIRFNDYSTLPPAGNTSTVLSAGTCTVTPTLTGTVWQLSTVALDTSGSGYLTLPAVTASSGNITATLLASLTAALTQTAGAGKVLLDGTGTKLGISGATGGPVLSLGATIDNSGVRQSLGSTYTVPQNTSLVRFTQVGTVASSTVTLPTAFADGQVIQFVMYGGSVTSFTFSPSVNGWTNTTTFASNTGVRIRWDATAAAWEREQ